MNPIISVIMPVYNSEKYIICALKSLSNQTFKDFEIIAINDGSSDKSLELLNEYKVKESRLIVINQKKCGIAKALNKGIELAKGKYIARMDSDDICMPERFENQLNYLQEKDLDLCGTKIKKFGNITGISDYPIDSSDCYLSLLFRTPFAHPTILVKKSIIQRYRYNEEYKYSQDYELWCRMALDSIKMGNIPEILLKYRCSDNQITSLKKNEQLKLALITASNYWNNQKICNGLSYPICAIDINNNEFNELKKSISSLKELQNRLKPNDYNKKFLKYEQFKLISRLSAYGYRQIRPFIINNEILSKKEKIILNFMALTRAIIIIYFIKNNINTNIIKNARNILYSILFKISHKG